MITAVFLLKVNSTHVGEKQRSQEIAFSSQAADIFEEGKKIKSLTFIAYVLLLKIAIERIARRN